MLQFVKSQIKKNKYITALYRAHKSTNTLAFEYKVDFQPRWIEGDGHPQLSQLIAPQLIAYNKTLSDFEMLKPVITRINAGNCGFEVSWNNAFIPAFDAMAIMWAAENTKNLYVEVGSGNSTKFAAAAIQMRKSKVSLCSIDPHPRSEIDVLCDEVIRQPLEQVDLTLFDRLEKGDTLFIDNSHRSFMNTDVTTAMLDILPRLKPGVRVGFHDIFLPFDYFKTWCERGYNEQYLLACYLLANPDYFNIQIPSYWLHEKGISQRVLSELWSGFDGKLKHRAPSSFWLLKN